MRLRDAIRARILLRLALRDMARLRQLQAAEDRLEARARACLDTATRLMTGTARA
ncbi:hypothetical protein ABZT49_16120 [Methylobacterium sp. EM32]|uniref:hypothetical protein n=1 Tax=Methylobacterium sp. EM32 TaxID=3163481 RepID=UPI0033B848B5